MPRTPRCVTLAASTATVPLAVRLVAVPAVLAAAVALSACGTGSSGDSGGLPTYTGSSAGDPSGGTTSASSSGAGASTSPEPDPSPWTALPTISKGPNKGVYQGVVLGSSVAKTPEEQAAVDAYVAYWALGAKAGYDVKVSQAQLDKVTTGSLQKAMRNWVASLRKKGARTVGWTAIHITKIDVGEQAVLLYGCIDNGSYDVDRKTGKRLEEIVPAYDAEGAVREVDGRLVVTYSRSEDRNTPCPLAGG